MAITLTNSYQYIGRTSGVQASNANYYYYVLLYAKTSGNTSNGKHTVSVKMRLACTANSSFYAYYTDGSVKIGSVSAISWDGQQVPNAAWGGSSLTEGGVTYARYIDLREGSAVIDTQYAAKDITITASWQRNSISSTPPAWLPKTTTITASIAVTLPLIPAASTITSAGAVTLGNACSVKWTPATSSFRYKLKFAIGSWGFTTRALHPNQTSAYTYTGYAIPLEVAKQLPTGRTGTMTVTLYTYSDSGATVQIGSADSETFTVTVPDNTDTKPTVSMSLTPVSTLPSTFNGLYVQGVTKVKATLSAKGKYNAGIASYMMKVDGVFYYSDDEYTSGYLTTAGIRNVYGYATDDRCHIGEASTPITVLPYNTPKLENASAVRCDAAGNVSDSGTYLKISAKRSYSPVVSGGVQKNFCEIRYRYSDGRSYSDWVTILGKNILIGDTITTPALLNGELSNQASYTIQIQAIDDVGRYADTFIIIPTESVYWHRDGARNALGLGKYNERDNGVDSAWDFYMNGHKITGLPAPAAETDAVPKSYVDPADVKLEKNLNAPGWYKIGTISGEMCAVMTIIVGGVFVNNQASPSMVDIATQHNQARMFLRLPSLADSQISKIGLVRELTTVYGVYAYYNTSNLNTVKINIHPHMGTFTPENWVTASVAESGMTAVMTLKA